MSKWKCFCSAHQDCAKGADLDCMMCAKAELARLRAENEALVKQLAESCDEYRADKGGCAKLLEWMGAAQDADSMQKMAIIKVKEATEILTATLARAEAAEAKVAALTKDRDIESREKFKALAELDEATAKIAQMREALVSISKNTCCGSCQEAKLVALAALSRLTDAPITSEQVSGNLSAPECRDCVDPVAGKCLEHSAPEGKPCENCEGTGKVTDEAPDWGFPCPNGCPPSPGKESK